MHRLGLLLLIAGCGSSPRPAPETVDNGGGDDTTHVAPCFHDKTEITARELFEAATANKLGSCTIDTRTESAGGEDEREAQTILDGDDVVATFDPCGVDVRVPGIRDDAGVGVGDPFAAVIAAYPEPKYTYDVAGGLGGEAQLAFHMDDLDVAWITLDGMDGDDLEPQHVASYRTSFACD